MPSPGNWQARPPEGPRWTTLPGAGYRLQCLGGFVSAATAHRNFEMVSALSDRSGRVILQEKRGDPTKSTRDDGKKIGEKQSKK